MGFLHVAVPTAVVLEVLAFLDYRCVYMVLF